MKHLLCDCFLHRSHTTRGAPLPHSSFPFWRYGHAAARNTPTPPRRRQYADLETVRRLQCETTKRRHPGPAMSYRDRPLAGQGGERIQSRPTPCTPGYDAGRRVATTCTGGCGWHAMDATTIRGCGAAGMTGAATPAPARTSLATTTASGSAGWASTTRSTATENEGPSGSCEDS